MVQGDKRGLAFEPWYGSTSPWSLNPGGARLHKEAQ
jgi:hypothetical protein